MCQCQLSSPSVAERRGDAALRRHGMRARRENLRQHRDAQVGARELERRAHSGAAGAHDDRVEFADRALSPQDLDGQLA